jgi:hypothetical protein
MLRTAGIACVAALVAGPLSWAGGSTLGARTATAVLSDDGAGARPVALTISVRAELQCGRLRSSSITVSLPSAMRVPASLPRAAVSVSGRAAASVRTSGMDVIVQAARPQGITCDALGPGVARITFLRAAGLGNPARAGSYGFEVVATPLGGRWHGVISIH